MPLCALRVDQSETRAMRYCRCKSFGVGLVPLRRQKQGCNGDELSESEEGPRSITRVSRARKARRAWVPDRVDCGRVREFRERL